MAVAFIVVPVILIPIPVIASVAVVAVAIGAVAVITTMVPASAILLPVVNRSTIPPRGSSIVPAVIVSVLVVPRIIRGLSRAGQLRNSQRKDAKDCNC